MALAVPTSLREHNGKVNDVLSNPTMTIEDFDSGEIRMVSSRNKKNGTIIIGSYHVSAPLIRPSRLTTLELGGIGKNLSEGWCLNYAIGCTHGCPFCYVDSIHKRFGVSRYGEIVRRKWGDYFLMPSNLEEVIKQTPWSRWKDKEVMLSSTHDPYLCELKDATKEILEVALQEGVRFCIQTRSHNIMRDFKLLSEFKDQIRIQVSIATSNKKLSQLIEPRVPSVERRIEVLKKAKDLGIDIGVIIAPIFPRLNIRPDIESDLINLTELLSEVKPNHIFAESLHLRGNNYQLLEETLGEPIHRMNDFDGYAGALLKQIMNKAGLKLVWWSEHSKEKTLEQRDNFVAGASVRNNTNSNRGDGKCRGSTNLIGTGLKITSGL